VASENAVRDALGDRAFIVRPGLITGPGDGSDRFGYWPGRFSRGGRVLVPAQDSGPTQFVDVRDLAEWIVTAAEQRLTGTFDAISRPRPLGDLLRDIAALVLLESSGPEVELVPAIDEQLLAAGVGYWAGPKSLPLWVSSDMTGFGAHDPSASLAAGLTIRPLADAVAGALAHERELGIDRPRSAGLSADEEAQVLAALA
jgi:hypothetical protein